MQDDPDEPDVFRSAASTPVPPLASTSALPFPSSSPQYPSTFRPASGNSNTRHSRIPSRSERYDTLVESARALLQQTDGGSHKPEEDAWRECVGSLLNVIDGMARQLSTHDELAASLKIAQSNLTLAETHTEFLEETLRRHSQSSAPRPRATTSHSDRPPSTTLVGLGLDEFDPAPPKPGFFGRLPSNKRKLTPSTTSVSSNPTGDSPRTSDTWGEHGEVTELRGTVSKLQQANGALEMTTKELEGRCAELEQTKDELMGELESLSVELFEEANKMVADERKARARAEEDVVRLAEELRSGRDGDGEGGALRRAEEDLERALGLGGSLGQENGSPPSLSPLQIASRPLEDRPGSTTPVENGPSLRKWFNFGRAAGTKQGSLDVPPIPPSRLMLRGQSGTSTQSSESRMSVSSASSSASSSVPFPDELELDDRTPTRPIVASRHIIAPLSLPRSQAPAAALDLFRMSSPTVTSPTAPTPPSKSPANSSFPSAFSLPPPVSTSPPPPPPHELPPTLTTSPIRLSPSTHSIESTDTIEYPTPSTDFPPEAAYPETLYTSPSLYPLPPSPSPSAPPSSLPRSQSSYPTPPSYPTSHPTFSSTSHPTPSPTRLSTRPTRLPFLDSSRTLPGPTSARRLPSLDTSARSRALASLDAEARSPRSPNAARWKQKAGFASVEVEPVPTRVWKPQSRNGSGVTEGVTGEMTTSDSMASVRSVGSTGNSIEDLDALMRNISSMSEMMFGEGGEEGGGEGETK